MVKRRRPAMAVEDVDLDELVFFGREKRRRVESFELEKGEDLF
jgi:hypothetical protein